MCVCDSNPREKTKTRKNLQRREQFFTSKARFHLHALKSPKNQPPPAPLSASAFGRISSIYNPTF